MAGVAALPLASALAAPTAARASCAAALVVDGVVLYGTSLEAVPGVLPPRGARHPAIAPACNDSNGDDDKDRRTTVTSLAGMPPRVAVAEVGDDTSVYVAQGSLLALAGHPLHATFYGERRRPSRRRGRACRNDATLRGTVRQPTGGSQIVLSIRGRERIVRVDARSRITNRPVHQPVLAGQRLELRTSLCGSRRVADRITFTGATVLPAGYARRADGGGDMPIVHVIAAALLLVGIAVVLKITPENGAAPLR